jgi:hypothetical protein
MEQGVPGRLRDRLLDRYEHPIGQVAVAGVLHISPDGQDGDLAGRGVEVPGDHDPRLRVGVEDVVDEPSDLDGLRHPFHGGDERPFGPGAGAAPGVGVDLLAGDVRRDLRFQVHVDDVQTRAPDGFQFDMQDGPLYADLDRRRIGRESGEPLVRRLADEVVAKLPATDDGQVGDDDEVAFVVDRIGVGLGADQACAVEVGVGE